MTTQLEDAASIVGEELAEEMAEKASEHKADLVIKSDAEEEVVEEETVEEEVIEEEKSDTSDKKKKKDDEEDDDDDEKAKEEEKSEAVEIVVSHEEVTPHVLNSAVDVFLSAYDEISSEEISRNEKAAKMQEHFNSFAEAIKSSFEVTEEEVAEEEISELKALVIQMSEQVQSLTMEIGIVKQQGLPTQTIEKPSEVRRSIQISPTQLFTPTAQGKPMSIREFSRRSVDLQ